MADARRELELHQRQAIVTKRQPQASSENRKHEALGLCTAGQLAAVCSHRYTGRGFLRPGRRPRQHQVGHIRARDEEPERYGAQRSKQGRADRAAGPILQRFLTDVVTVRHGGSLERELLLENGHPR